VRAGETLVPDLAWSYPDPVPECAKIKDLVCFFDERVDVVVDGSTPYAAPRAGAWSRAGLRWRAGETTT
jgi:hypothetical protein